MLSMGGNEQRKTKWPRERSRPVELRNEGKRHKRRGAGDGRESVLGAKGEQRAVPVRQAKASHQEYAWWQRAHRRWNKEKQKFPLVSLPIAHRQGGESRSFPPSHLATFFLFPTPHTSSGAPSLVLQALAASRPLKVHKCLGTKTLGRWASLWTKKKKRKQKAGFLFLSPWCESLLSCCSFCLFAFYIYIYIH